MDLSKTLEGFRSEKEKLERVIALLEQLQAQQDHQDRRLPATTPGRRGRKSMGPDERRVVSERMKRYWEHRRNCDDVAAT